MICSLSMCMDQVKFLSNSSLSLQADLDAANATKLTFLEHQLTQAQEQSQGAQVCAGRSECEVQRLTDALAAQQLQANARQAELQSLHAEKVWLLSGMICWPP